MWRGSPLCQLALIVDELEEDVERGVDVAINDEAAVRAVVDFRSADIAHVAAARACLGGVLLSDKDEERAMLRRFVLEELPETIVGEAVEI